MDLVNGFGHGIILVKLDTSYALFVSLECPYCVLLVIPDKHHMKPENIGTVSFYHLKGINGIFGAFGHFFAIVIKDKSIAHTAGKRKLMLYYANVIKEVMPKTGIKHVSCYMLCTAGIQIHCAPIIKLILPSKGLRVVWIDEAQPVPYINT